MIPGPDTAPFIPALGVRTIFQSTLSRYPLNRGKINPGPLPFRPCCRSSLRGVSEEAGGRHDPLILFSSKGLQCSPTITYLPAGCLLLITVSKPIANKEVAGKPEPAFIILGNNGGKPQGGAVGLKQVTVLGSIFVPLISFMLLKMEKRVRKWWRMDVEPM